MIMPMHVWFAQTPMLINYTFELGRVYVEGKYGNANSINLKYDYTSTSDHQPLPLPPLHSDIQISFKILPSNN